MTQLRFRREFRSAADLDRCTRDLSIHLDDISGEITLAESVLLASETGRALYRKGEELNRSVWCRKRFILDDAACWSAQLICYLYEHAGNSSPLRIHVNGHPLTLPEGSGYQGWNIWYSIAVPPEYLQAGTNEIIFYSDSSCFDSWRLGIENGRSKHRSAKSSDAGQTWRQGLMGYDNSQGGEYLVRLRLGRYASRGTITSPVIDLNEGCRDMLGGRIRDGKARVTAECSAPGNTQVSVRVRAGRSRLPSPDNWTAWQVSPEDGWLDIGGDWFIQWQATLTTSGPLTSPTLKAVTIEASAVLADGIAGPEVVESSSPEIVESSLVFSYQDPKAPKLVTLRQRERLDDVVAGADSEWERSRLLRTWVSQQWRGGGSELFYCPWDALVILDWKRRLGDQVRAGCIHYAVVFCQCCLALGWQARLVVLARHRTMHTAGHFVAEVWSNQWEKWIVMDAHLDIHYERDGIPLSALELHQIWAQGEVDSVVQIAGPGNLDHPMGSTWALEGFREGLYRYWGLVMRNDQLTSLEPGPLEHGLATYRWTGFVWWGEAVRDELPQFPLHSSRVADFSWSLGHVAADLYSEGTGAISVHLAARLPHLDHFQVRRNGQAWERSDGTYRWNLEPGQNSLTVRAVNSLGVHGAESHVRLVWNPEQAAEDHAR